MCCDKKCIHSNKENAFPIINGIPFVISEIRTDTVCSVEIGKTYIERPMSGRNKLKKIFAGESRATRKNCKAFVDEIFKITEKPKILIVGGGEKGSGTEWLWNFPEVEIDSFDIYASSTTDLVCDAHYMPLKSSSYDGVWIQAVLEHVVEPHKVVAEIHRVLKAQGVVYAETPFMQQVHEGAYDFTRYTVLGHRYLFKNFELIDMGGNKGPEIVLSWAVRYFIWGLTRSRRIARICGVGFGIVMRPFAMFVSNKAMFDASSGVYFLGRKPKETFCINHKELISLYKGQF